MQARWRVAWIVNISAVPVGSPVSGNADGFDSDREIAIVFTSLSATVSAIEHTAALLQGLHFRMSLVWPQTVPSVLSLDEPAISTEFSKRVLLNLARLSPSISRVQLCFCRHRLEALASLISAQSPIVIGTRKSLWSLSEKKLARGLRRAGYNVLLIQSLTARSSLFPTRPPSILAEGESP